MTALGMTILIVSNFLIILLTGYCFYRVMTDPNTEETEHALLEIDTRDLDES
jgi:hypothetical protein